MIVDGTEDRGNGCIGSVTVRARNEATKVDGYRSRKREGDRVGCARPRATSEHPVRGRERTAQRSRSLLEFLARQIKIGPREKSPEYDDVYACSDSVKTNSQRANGSTRGRRNKQRAGEDRGKAEEQGNAGEEKISRGRASLVSDPRVMATVH